MWNGPASFLDLEQEEGAESGTLRAWKVVLTLGSAEMADKCLVWSGVALSPAEDPETEAVS